MHSQLALPHSKKQYLYKKGGVFTGKDVIRAIWLAVYFA